MSGTSHRMQNQCKTKPLQNLADFSMEFGVWLSSPGDPRGSGMPRRGSKLHAKVSQDYKSAAAESLKPIQTQYDTNTPRG